MRSGKRNASLHQDRDFHTAIESGSPLVPERHFEEQSRLASEVLDAAKAKDKPAKIDRGSDFLVGAANGDNPTPDYDEALDTLATFMTDEYYPYFDEERRSFEIGADGFITVSVSDLSKSGRTLALHSLDVWTAATGIAFKVVKGEAEITFSNDHAFAYTDTYVDGNRITSSVINISEGWMDKHGRGIYDYSMLSFIHEMGHALGLGHSGVYGGYPPIENPPDPLPNDSWQATIMSYNSQDENDNIDADYAIPITPMLADLLAIADLYGVRDIRTGDNVYSYKAAISAGASLSVIDSDGNDRLDFSWSKKANVIDLHEEVFSSINGMKGNVGIARGTVIEGAVGGIKGDTIIGNDYANALYGNLGKDTLTGNDGDDFFVFDTAPSAKNADVITDFATGEDSLVFNNAVYVKIGKDGALKIGAFASNETGDAQDKSDRVIHDTVTGDVFYDADGSKAGKAVLVANIGAGTGLTAGDVWVI